MQGLKTIGRKYGFQGNYFRRKIWPILLNIDDDVQSFRTFQQKEKIKFFLVLFVPGNNKFEEQIEKDVDRSLLCFENFDNCSEENL